MRYVEPRPITLEEANAAFLRARPDEVADALVRLTFHSSDWRHVQELCIKLLNEQDQTVRGAAVTCLGHIARLRHRLDRSKVVALLEALRTDPIIGGRAEDALDDIENFLPKEEAPIAQG